MCVFGEGGRGEGDGRGELLISNCVCGGGREVDRKGTGKMIHLFSSQ